LIIKNFTKEYPLYRYKKKIEKENILINKINKNYSTIPITSHVISASFSENDKEKEKNKDIDNPIKKLSVYKRIPKDLGIPFNSCKSQIFLKESISEGNALAFFDIIDQFQTQADPTFCGPTTLSIVLNSLGIDPYKKWKG
jgi:hypothetical protein